MDFSLSELTSPIFNISFLLTTFYFFTVFIPVLLLLYYVIKTYYRPKTRRSFFRSVAIIVSLQILFLFIGIVAENGLDARQRTSQKRTLEIIIDVSKAISRYMDINHHYPIGHDLNTLQSALVPNYIQLLPNDGWNQPFQYESDSEGSKYYFYSIGGDGKMDVARSAEYTKCDTYAWESDIVISNNTFVREPLRKQSFRFRDGNDNNCYPPKRK